MELQGSGVLVTGGTGMLGSHVVDALLREGAGDVVVLDARPPTSHLEPAMATGRVRTVVGDIRDPDVVHRACAGVGAVVHTAAVLTTETRQDASAAAAINVLGSHEVFRTAGRLGVERIVMASSVAVYGSPDGSASRLTEDSPSRHPSLYGASKLAGEAYGHAFAQMDGHGFVPLRFGTLYGPRLHRKGVVPRMLFALLDAVDGGRPPTVDADPASEHDFVYVQDAADAVVQALRSDGVGRPFNIVTGEAISLRQFFSTALRRYGVHEDPRWNPPQQPLLPPRRAFSGRLAHEVLGFRPATSLESGLDRFLAWRRSHREASPDR